MAFDIEMIKKVYSQMVERVDKAREITGKPLTLSEKILIQPSLGWKCNQGASQRKGLCRFCSRSYSLSGRYRANGFITIYASWKKKVAVPTTVHCDHLIQATDGATKDLQSALIQ